MGVQPQLEGAVPFSASAMCTDFSSHRRTSTGYHVACVKKNPAKQNAGNLATLASGGNLVLQDETCEPLRKGLWNITRPIGSILSNMHQAIVDVFHRLFGTARDV